MKKVEKNAKKVFTKKESNDIIKKDYNPLKVNKKIYERGSGLLMEDKVLLSEVTEELNFIEKLLFKRKFIKIYKKGIKKGFNWNNIFLVR